MTTSQSPQEAQQYLTFRTLNEEYAIRVLKIKEILRYGEVTRVPSTPPSIRGVINVRGSVVPVIDLAVRFGADPKETTKWTCIVIVETVIDGLSAVMGVVADSVQEVVDFSEMDVNVTSPRSGEAVSPRDYLGKVSAWYFGHAT